MKSLAKQVSQLEKRIEAVERLVRKDIAPDSQLYQQAVKAVQHKDAVMVAVQQMSLDRGYVRAAKWLQQLRNVYLGPKSSTAAVLLSAGELRTKMVGHGGKRAHILGWAHPWNSEETKRAREAGQCHKVVLSKVQKSSKNGL